jgi:hypothetical protein
MHSKSYTNSYGVLGTSKKTSKKTKTKKPIAKSKVTKKTHNQAKCSKKISPSFVLSPTTRCIHHSPQQRSQKISSAATGEVLHHNRFLARL